MIKHLSSKIAIGIYVLIAIGLCFWGFVFFKDQNIKTVSIPLNSESTQGESTTSANDLPNDNGSENGAQDLPADNSTAPAESDSSDSSTAVSKNPISTTPIIKGDKLANITPEHCNNGCQAFKIDLKLFEYCEQACGISPIKKVDNCDDKKDLQKVYCLKDLAIGKKDLAKCDDVKDANIKQACKNYIEQDALETLQQNNPPRNEAPAF